MSGICGIFVNVLCFWFYVLHTKTQVVQSDPCVQCPDHCGPIHAVIALKSYKWNIMELYGRTGHYKVGTHDVRKSLFLSVYKHI
jgi:hypothetical protein